MKAIGLPPVIQRYELKYMVPKSLVDPITDFVMAYCDFDYYSSLSPSNIYAVNSLYFDTRGNEFLEQRLWGKIGRFNMRVRSYEDGTAPPYFLEIKKKQGQAVSKYRSTIGAEDWPAILVDPDYVVPDHLPDKEKINRNLFIRLGRTYAIEPKIFTRYKRRALFSVVDEYARVTMDFDMQYRTQTLLSNDGDPYCLQPKGSLTNYDNETIYAVNTQSDANVVLELKCDIGKVPTWIIDLVTFFELKQVGFSKYMQSSLVSKFDNGYAYMSNDRKGIFLA